MTDCLHNDLKRSSVDGESWFWVCSACGEFFDIRKNEIAVQFGTTSPENLAERDSSI